ncbi:MAG: putative transport system permease protein [Polyangiaceae bacterium]|nr:putative transport system permease protein [Polyangiaceae bacterium]
MSAPSPAAPAAAEPSLGKLFGTLTDMVALVGAEGVLLARILARTFSGQMDRAELVRCLYRMGIRSVPIVTVTALFVGGIMVIQAAPTVERYGAQGLLGWAAGFGTLREIAPLLTALMISGRVGANNTAELGTMTVTEQVDALRAMAIDPIGYLVTPRFFGIVITLFLSTILADALALVGASLAGKALLGVDPAVFYNGLTGGLLGVTDVVNGLVKSVVFGVAIALSSCHFGLSTEGGAPGVGRAVNSAVVVSAAGIFVLDYLISFAIP